MLHYLRQGIILSAVSFTALSFASEKKEGDLSFEVIPDISNITTNACFTPVLATYTIISGTPVPLTLQEIKINDALPDDVVSIVDSPSNSCKKNQKLAMNEMCNITVSFQPCEQGRIDRELIIEIDTTEGALTSPISTDVTKILLQVTAGNDVSESPLLVDSQDNGHTWNEVPSCITASNDAAENPLLVDSHALAWNSATPCVPDLPTAVSFNTAACNLDNTCIVAGQDQTGTSGNYPPLLLTTLNSGTNWTKVTKVINSNNVPVDLPAVGRFNGASCSGNNCIAVGLDISDNFSPILINSLNAGADWYQRSITNGPAKAELFGGSCSGNLCIVVGSDQTTNPSPLLLASSTDGGVNWNRITTLENGDSLPSGAAFSDSAPSCSNKICITGGSIHSFFPFPPPPPTPFLISAVNSVSSWNLVSTVGNGLPAAGSFNGYSCSENNCIAVGHNQTTGKILIVNTTDGGNTWNQVTSLSDGSPLPSGFLDNASCSNNNCIAGGEGPLLLSSSDGGKNWKQITTASGDSFPNYGSINSTGCTGNICMAVGGDIVHEAFLLTSLDGGNNWDNVSSAVKPSGLPPTGGDLNTVSISR